MNRNEFVSMLECAQKSTLKHLRIQYRDYQLADEVSWEVAVSAFEQYTSDPDTFSDVASLRGWMRKRAMWRVTDTLRYRNKHATLEISDDEGNTDTVLVARDASQDATRMEVWDTLSHLDEEERSILLAYYYDGLTDQDIGTRIYGEEGSLQSRGLKVWRRRQKIQERLRETMEESGWTCADLAAV